MLSQHLYPGRITAGVCFRAIPACLASAWNESISDADGDSLKLVVTRGGQYGDAGRSPPSPNKKITFYYWLCDWWQKLSFMFQTNAHPTVPLAQHPTIKKTHNVFFHILGFFSASMNMIMFCFSFIYLPSDMYCCYYNISKKSSRRIFGLLYENIDRLVGLRVSMRSRVSSPVLPQIWNVD